MKLIGGRRTLRPPPPPPLFIVNSRRRENSTRRKALRQFCRYEKGVESVVALFGFVRNKVRPCRAQRLRFGPALSKYALVMSGGIGCSSSVCASE
jgi:hypothetical protein